MKTASCLMALAAILFSSTGAWAVTHPKAPPADAAESREDVEYRRAIARIEAQRRRGIEPSAESFRGLSWVGKTAAINYSCSTLSLATCRSLLDVALQDRALFVRDHALKVILASERYLPEEKMLLARKAIDDDRNYRGGVALWIVERARKYIAGFKG